MTGKGTFIVGNQQMVFEYKCLSLEDSGKTNPHFKTLCTVTGRVSRPTQFTHTQGISKTDSTDSDNHEDVTAIDTASGQAGAVTDEHKRSTQTLIYT